MKNLFNLVLKRVDGVLVFTTHAWRPHRLRHRTHRGDHSVWTAKAFPPPQCSRGQQCCAAGAPLGPPSCVSCATRPPPALGRANGSPPPLGRSGHATLIASRRDQSRGTAPAHPRQVPHLAPTSTRRPLLTRRVASNRALHPVAHACTERGARPRCARAPRKRLLERVALLPKRQGGQDEGALPRLLNPCRRDPRLPRWPPRLSYQLTRPRTSIRSRRSSSTSARPASASPEPSSDAAKACDLFPIGPPSLHHRVSFLLSVLPIPISRPRRRCLLQLIF